MSSGNLFIISAPSGAGKTTILKRVMADLPGLDFLVSHTTREPRSGERDGMDYHFVDQAAFQRLRDSGGFLEWAKVHGNYYGTSRKSVEEGLASGRDLVLDIDVQGADQIRKATGLAAVFIFIAPPSREELSRRLSWRGTDSRATIARRCENALQEMQAQDRYDYLIVNKDLEQAVDTLRAIIIAERSRGRRAPDGGLLLPLGFSSV